MKTRTLLMLSALLTASCAVYDDADVDVIVADGESRAARTVSVGGAATVKIVPKGRSEYSGTEAVSIRAQTPSLAQAKRTFLADTWTILGVAPGRATFTVYVDEVRIDTFSFTVEPFEGGEL